MIYINKGEVYPLYFAVQKNIGLVFIGSKNITTNKNSSNTWFIRNYIIKIINSLTINNNIVIIYYWLYKFLIATIKLSISLKLLKYPGLTLTVPIPSVPITLWIRGAQW